MSVLKGNSRGSITVEASISFPIFLSIFFLLLFLVKFVCTGMILDYAVNEAAREIAASAYPISFLNELEDDKLGGRETGIPGFEGGPRSPEMQAGEEIPADIVSLLMSGEIKGSNLESIFKGALEDYRKGALGYLTGSITPAYWDLKASAKDITAMTLIRKYLDDKFINPAAIKLRLVEFPQSGAEYERKSITDIYRKYGLIPEQDFFRDDVVLQLEYDYNVKLPFIKEFKVKMVHTAVEKAWLMGSFGVVTEKDEGLDLDSGSTYMFVTRTGIRYHLGSCRYLRKSKIPIEINEAKSKGYTPCKVCRPPN